MAVSLSREECSNVYCSPVHIQLENKIREYWWEDPQKKSHRNLHCTKGVVKKEAREYRVNVESRSNLRREVRTRDLERRRKLI